MEPSFWPNGDFGSEVMEGKLEFSFLLLQVWPEFTNLPLQFLQEPDGALVWYTVISVQKGTNTPKFRDRESKEKI